MERATRARELLTWEQTVEPALWASRVGRVREHTLQHIASVLPVGQEKTQVAIRKMRKSSLASNFTALPEILVTQLFIFLLSQRKDYGLQTYQ
jgi:hypothetical protein